MTRVSNSVLLKQVFQNHICSEGDGEADLVGFVSEHSFQDQKGLLLLLFSNHRIQTLETTKVQ